DGADKTGDGVEQGGLAGAVRTDDANDLAGVNSERDFIEGSHRTEAHAEAGDYQGMARMSRGGRGRGFAQVDPAPSARRLPGAVEQAPQLRDTLSVVLDGHRHKAVGGPGNDQQR